MAMHRKFFNPPKEFLEVALFDIGYSRPYHPVLDYLMSLNWDGQPRLDAWLATYLGAEDTPLNRAFGRCQLMAAVARVRDPGCKKDEMLVLQGPQGIGKSSALRILASAEWFTDALKAGMKSQQVIELTEGGGYVRLRRWTAWASGDQLNQRQCLVHRVTFARLRKEVTSRPRSSYVRLYERQCLPGGRHGQPTLLASEVR
jgi:hypothetical protein